MEDLLINHWLILPGDEISWHAARSGGPGGQNVNKVNTKVHLRFDLRKSRALAPAIKARLRAIAENRLDSDGRIAIISATSRSQSANLQEARERLRELILEALVVPKKRKKTKPSKGSQKRRLKAKTARSQLKRQRSKSDWD